MRTIVVVRACRAARAGLAALALLAVAAGAVAAPRGPARVVTLAPHLTELVYAAGAGERLVGTVAPNDWPPDARRLALVGDATRLDPERLLALRPDLVIAWSDGSPAEQLALLERLKLPVLPLRQNALADVPASIERLGELFGTEPVAHAAATRLAAELAALGRRYAGRPRLRVYYQVWGTPLYTVGSSQVVSEMLAVCGARNVFDDQRASAFVVDEESVYARDPDVVVLAGTPRETEAWRGWWEGRPRLRAFRTGAVVALDPDLVNRMGPRIAAGTAALCAALDGVRARALAPAAAAAR